MATAGAGTALATHGVNLIDEDDARAILLGLLEQVTHAGGTHADEHLHEVGTGDGIERHAGLARHGAGQKRLTGTRRAIEQHAARDLRAQRMVALRIIEEVLDLLELVHRFIRASHIREGVGRHVLGQLLGLGAANAEHAARALLHAGHHPEQQREEDQHGQQEADHGTDEGILRDLGLVLIRTGILDRVEDLLGGTCRVLGNDLLDALLLFYRYRLLELEAQLLLAVVDLRFLDVLGGQLLHGHRSVHLLEAAGIVGKERECVQQDENQARDGAVADDVLVFH